MSPFKEKHLNRYQRLRYKLKREMNKDKGDLVNRLKIMWYKSALERIRINQIARGGK